MGFATTLTTSVQGVGRLLFMAFVGAFLNRRGHLDGVRRRSLSKVALICLLPCLLFINVAESVSPSRLATLIIAPFFAALFNSSGNAIGFLLGRCLVRPSDSLTVSHIQASIGYGNHGYIPLVVLPAVLEGDPFRYGESLGPVELADRIEEDVQHALALISVFITVITVSTWSFGFALMANGAEELKGRDRLRQPTLTTTTATTTTTTTTTTSPAASLLAHDGAAVDPGSLTEPEHPVPRASEQEASSVSRASPSPPSPTLPTAVPASVWARTVDSLQNPPILAALLGIAVGLVTPIKELLFTSATMKDANEAAPLEVIVTASLNSLGHAITPIILLILGSNIAELLLGDPLRSADTDAGHSPGAAPSDTATTAPSVAPSDASATRSWLARQPERARQLACSLVSGAAWVVRGLASAFSWREDPSNPPPVRRSLMWAILASKLVLMPLVGTAILIALASMGAVDRSDKVLLLTLLIQTATPIAMDISLICAVVGRGEREIASVVLWQYLASILTLTFWISAFITLIDGGLAVSSE